MRTLLIAVVIFAVAEGAPRYRIDEHVDRLLPIVNNFIGLMGWENVTLPDYGLPGTPVFFGVSLGNLTTIRRTGMCEMWGEGVQTLNLVFNVGLGSMRVDVEYAPIIMAPVTLVIKGASAELGVRFVKDSPKQIDCTTKWDYIEVKTLGDVWMHTSNKQYDNKPFPQQLIPSLISHYNGIFNSKGHYSIKNLNDVLNICNIPNEATS